MLNHSYRWWENGKRRKGREEGAADWEAGYGTQDIERRREVVGVLLPRQLTIPKRSEPGSVDGPVAGVARRSWIKQTRRDLREQSRRREAIVGRRFDRDRVAFTWDALACSTPSRLASRTPHTICA